MKKYDELFLEETEIKPNRYVANSMLMTTPVLFITWMLNEADIFLVDKSRMRIACFFGILFLFLPQMIIHNKQWIKHPLSKFIIMFCQIGSIFIVLTILNLWGLLIIMFPLLLSTQYHNYRIFYFTLAGLLLCLLVTPILAALNGLWPMDYLSFLVNMSGHEIISYRVLENQDPINRALQILQYIGLPRSLILLSTSIIVHKIHSIEIDRINRQIKNLQSSETDPLTHLMNRASFMNSLPDYKANCKESITCVYADVNGLHELNNTKGHQAGDEMLICCSNILASHFGNEHTYRFGGDEFVAILLDHPQDKLERSLLQIRQEIEAHGYSISIGVNTQGTDFDTDHLLRSAELEMYREKALYYEHHKSDRSIRR